LDFINVFGERPFTTMRRFGCAYLSLEESVAGPSTSRPAGDKPAATKGEKVPSSPGSKNQEKGKSSPSKPKGAQPKKTGDPLNSSNPLGVKSEVKSSALSAEQRAALRKHFKLVEGLVPSDEWDLMDRKHRNQALKDRTIPKWASSAVLKRPSNLELILKGKLTVDNVGATLSVATQNQKPGASQALEAWTKLRSDFKGVTLFREPITGREKAFKKRFDSLLADYGNQPCFPKLRERPDRQSSRSPSAKDTSKGGTGGMDGFLNMLKLAVEISKIAKS
jgi:hypothetical protein